MKDTEKYLIHANIAADGVVERSDVVGAVFGQTEGLLGDELDLRDLQESSRVGRIDVAVESENGQSFGEVTVASSLDKVETAILAAALETIDRIGPCHASVEVTSIEDVRAAKRREVVERAKELVAGGFEETSLASDDILDEVREAARVEGIVDYEGLPAGPRVGDSDAVIVVEGRADVLLTLLECGIKNAVAVEGTNVPDAVADLTADRTVTAFLDGDRGGELILRELAQVGDVDYVAFAPPGESVEDLDRNTVFEALRGKVPYSSLADEPNLREAATDDSGSAPIDNEGRGRSGEMSEPSESETESERASDGGDDGDAGVVAGGARSATDRGLVDAVEDTPAPAATDAGEVDEVGEDREGTWKATPTPQISTTQNLTIERPTIRISTKRRMPRALKRPTPPRQRAALDRRARTGDRRRRQRPRPTARRRSRRPRGDRRRRRLRRDRGRRDGPAHGRRRRADRPAPPRRRRPARGSASCSAARSASSSSDLWERECSRSATSAPGADGGRGAHSARTIPVLKPPRLLRRGRPRRVPRTARRRTSARRPARSPSGRRTASPATPAHGPSGRRPPVRREASRRRCRTRRDRSPQESLGGPGVVAGTIGAPSPSTPVTVPRPSAVRRACRRRSGRASRRRCRGRGSGLDSRAGPRASPHASAGTSGARPDRARSGSSPRRPRTRRRPWRSGSESVATGRAKNIVAERSPRRRLLTASPSGYASASRTVFVSTVSENTPSWVSTSGRISPATAYSGKVGKRIAIAISAFASAPPNAPRYQNA